jgi:plasmid stabilization system protein ParE
MPFQNGFGCWRNILGSAASGTIWAWAAKLPLGSYVIVYEINGSDVCILRIVHGRRDFGSLFGG